MTDERECIKALEREVYEFRQANEILRKGSAYSAGPIWDSPGGSGGDGSEQSGEGYRLGRERGSGNDGAHVITQGVFSARAFSHALCRWSWDFDQAVMVVNRLAKGVALVRRAAVATTARMSASPLAAHIAR